MFRNFHMLYHYYGSDDYLVVDVACYRDPHLIPQRNPFPMHGGYGLPCGFHLVFVGGEVSVDPHKLLPVPLQPVFLVAEGCQFLFDGSQRLAAGADDGEFPVQAEGFALQLHEFGAVVVFDLEFRRDLDEVAVCFAQLVALQIQKIVVFVG